MKMLAITLISSIVFSGISEGGVSYGRGGPNQYARIVVVDLSIAIENLKPTLEQGKLSGEDLIRTKKMIDDACAGKCSETAIQNLITTQEDKEKLEVIHKEIYEQLVRMLQLARDHNPSKALQLLDEINKKIAEMKHNLQPPGSLIQTSSTPIGSKN